MGYNFKMRTHALAKLADHIALIFGMALFMVAGASLLTAAVSGRPDRSHIVFGYMQNQSSLIAGYRWQALTHVGTQFIEFDSDAALSGVTTFNNRSAELKPGGAAANNGVKVIAVLANAGFDEGILDTVMQSSSLRAALISNLVVVVSNPVTGCDGVNLDFEFAWGSATRDGVTLFIRDLNAALKALSPPRELSIYVAPTYYSAQYDLAGMRDNLDYMIYSGYDFSTGSTMTAVGRYGTPSSFSIVGNLDDYINGGMPAAKIVLALPFYTSSWTTTASGVYGQTGTKEAADSFTQANFATLYRSPVLTKHNSTPADHYTKWYTRSTGGSVYTLTTFDDIQTLEFKCRLAKGWKGNYSTGKQLAGVSFWSLMWLTESSSVDPNNQAGGAQSLLRTSSPPYTLLDEIFTPCSRRVYPAETFETISINSRWRNPGEGPDALRAGTCSAVMANAPAGAPSGSRRVAAVNVVFTGTPNHVFFKFQPLMDPTTPYRVDWDNSLVLVDAQSKFIADIHTPASYANATIRMVARDGLNQLEKGPAVTLSPAGWRRIEWDITSTATGNITAYSTSEKAYSSGNGVINTAGKGARDIAFAGFEISSTAANSATINIDQILYTHANPGGTAYVINEFRYASVAQQFVEIYGPAGPMPPGLILRAVSATAGDITTTIALGGNSIPDIGTGNGFWVIGASGMAALRNQAMADGALNSGAPSALQLFDTNMGTIYDAVTYRAYAGTGRLDSPNNPIVTDNGPGWYGEIAAGATVSGKQYSSGRYPDGANSFVNEADFSPMPASPGAPNGGSVVPPVTYDFEAAPPKAFRAYNNFSVQSSAVGPSPGGGNVHRCVDVNGGGNISLFGDAALGAVGAGYNVSGYVYAASDGGAATANATGLGLCARGGSTFFSNIPAASGYDSGYWLIYENSAGVGLNDGRPDHPGVFEFVHATNDGVSPAITTLLGSKSLAQAGLTAGKWTSFRLWIQPSAPAAEQLLAQINGVDVYRGPIPASGPTSGAFQAGFRENHTGVPATMEGTWIDSIQISNNFSTVGDWLQY